jgi:hypothetical protein
MFININISKPKNCALSKVNKNKDLNRKILYLKALCWALIYKNLITAWHITSYDKERCNGLSKITV